MESETQTLQEDTVRLFTQLQLAKCVCCTENPLRKKLQRFIKKQHQLLGKKQKLKTALLKEKRKTKKMEHKIQRLQSEVNSLKENGANRSKVNSELRVNVLQEQGCVKLNSSLEKNNETRRMNNYESKEESPDYMKKMVDEKNKQLQATLRELEETKSRLSRLMGDRLTDNNPNITDLSDKNRPTKISERYQELYDNQWTDAFEVVDKEWINEEQSATTLKDILTETTVYCKEEAANQMERIKADFTKGQIPGAQIMKQLKDLRKATAEVYGKELIQDFEAYVKEKRPDTIEIARKIPCFVQECFDICWLMAVQDPPVAFGPDVRQNEPFNKDYFKSYTKGGDRVKYVVWPVLLLHENGPVLCKGVAQGNN